MTQQCRGMTKSGEQCKMTRTLPNGYCFRHQNQAESVTPESEKEPAPTAPSDVKREAPPSPPPPPPQNEPESPTETPSANGTPEGLVPALFALLFVLLALLFFNRRRQIRFIRM